MCSRCHMAPSDEKIMRQRQGAVEIDDFVEVVPYRHPPRRKKREREKTRPGCPGNEYNEHVYVWTTEGNGESAFYQFYGFHKRESLMCVGCNKTRTYRDTARYERIKERKFRKQFGDEFSVERGTPKGRLRFRSPNFRWYSWERYEADYMAFRKAYYQERNWPFYYWS